nr:hypothetical protein [Desulfuromonadales bacterium]
MYSLKKPLPRRSFIARLGTAYAGLLLPGLAGCSQSPVSNDDWNLADEIRKAVQRPVIPG